jgi:hypothetical protein
MDGDSLTDDIAISQLDPAFFPRKREVLGNVTQDGVGMNPIVGADADEIMDHGMSRDGTILSYPYLIFYYRVWAYSDTFAQPGRTADRSGRVDDHLLHTSS